MSRFLLVSMLLLLRYFRLNTGRSLCWPFSPKGTDRVDVVGPCVVPYVHPLGDPHLDSMILLRKRMGYVTLPAQGLRSRCCTAFFRLCFDTASSLVLTRFWSSLSSTPGVVVVGIKTYLHTLRAHPPPDLPLHLLRRFFFALGDQGSASNHRPRAEGGQGDGGKPAAGVQTPSICHTVSVVLFRKKHLFMCRSFVFVPW